MAKRKCPICEQHLGRDDDIKSHPDVFNWAPIHEECLDLIEQAWAYCKAVAMVPFRYPASFIRRLTYIDVYPEEFRKLDKDWVVFLSGSTSSEAVISGFDTKQEAEEDILTTEGEGMWTVESVFYQGKRIRFEVKSHVVWGMPYAQ